MHGLARANTWANVDSPNGRERHHKHLPTSSAALAGVRSVKGDLSEYRRKRDFGKTPEPQGSDVSSAAGRAFVVQKHAASRLHYDLRLEMDGVLKSWAVPKGPTLDPSAKPLAVQTEDHPLVYAHFEGVIPAGEYGGGTVMIWDAGEWEPLGDPVQGYARGDLKFQLFGEKLAGAWALVRMQDDERNWLLLKKQDAHATPRHVYNVLREAPNSVVSGRTLEEIAHDADTVWKHGHAVEKASGQTTPAVRAHDVDLPAGARPAPQPRVFKPQLATTAADAPDGEHWLHEIKHDGYRLITVLQDGVPHLLTRNGHAWTDRFPGVARKLRALPTDNAILDGEIAVLDRHGIADFGALQRSISSGDRGNFSYFLFDLMHIDGHDLTRCRLDERKEVLASLLSATPGSSPTLRFSEHIVSNGPVVAREAEAAGLEGIICKRADAKYEQRRSSTWLKVKFRHREEFVVGGFTKPEGSRTGFGALLIGHHSPAGQLVYCGRVGSGFDEATLTDLWTQLQACAVETCAFVNPPRGSDARGVTWVDPTLVVHVEYGTWTHDGMVRHPVFLGVREDVRAAEVVRTHQQARDRPTEASPAVVRLSSAPGDAMVAGVRISNPDRIAFPEVGITKGDIARYYEHAAQRMLVHIARRPLSIVRCPDGVEGQRFYQKHVGEGFPKGIRGTPIADQGVEEPYLALDDAAGLVGLAQMGVLEIHQWGSREDRLDHPDQFVLDLDPGPGIVWEHIVESARFVRAYLQSLELTSYVKTSGGNGVHVVVPLQRRRTWETVKRFAHAIAKDLAKQAPGNFVATIAKSRRENRIFVDYLRNQRGATAVAPYAVRARDQATVSAPLHWDELKPETPPETYTVASMHERLGGPDPWQGFRASRQSITRAMEQTLGLS
jgi:bifunctional non-homologous end joining protein LigD